MTHHRHFIPFAALLLLALIQPAWSREATITPAGQRLAQVLDQMKVEQRWLPGIHVDWRTGKPDGKVYHTANSHTHCSAFAAAAAEKLGVYLLRPPEHSAELLANAQQDWLCGAGTNQGWYQVKSPLEAQSLANAGQLVVVTYKNLDPKKPGHIAIVRPNTKSEAEILAEGPTIIQAGGHNYTSTNAKTGFKNHPGAFENKTLLYFAHEVSSTLPPTAAVLKPRNNNEKKAAAGDTSNVALMLKESE